MEKILQDLKDEIKKLSNEESLNVNKLTELMNIYSRLERFSIKSVSQINQMDFDPDYRTTLVAPIGANPLRNEISMVYDTLKEIFLNKNNLFNTFGNRLQSNTIHDFLRMYEFMEDYEIIFSKGTYDNDYIENVKERLFSLIIMMIDINVNKQDKELKKELEKEQEMKKKQSILHL